MVLDSMEQDILRDIVSVFEIGFITYFGIQKLVLFCN